MVKNGENSFDGEKLRKLQNSEVLGKRTSKAALAKELPRPHWSRNFKVCFGQGTPKAALTKKL